MIAQTIQTATTIPIINTSVNPKVVGVEAVGEVVLGEGDDCVVGTDCGVGDWFEFGVGEGVRGVGNGVGEGVGEGVRGVGNGVGEGVGGVGGG